MSKSLIGYLDCLDASATDNSTIHHLLCRSLLIKDKLVLSAIVCVYDQSIFPKAVEIQSTEKEKFKSLVVVMGGSHALMMFLGVIGTHFEDVGLQDILILRGVLADRSAEQAITGSMYNLSIRIFKLMYEGLNRMLITKMEKEKVVYTKGVYNVLPLEWNNESCYHKFVDSEETKKYAITFYDFKERIC